MDPADRAKVDRYLRAGFACWQDAPCIPPEHPCCPTDCVESTPGGTCMRVVIMNFGSLDDFRALLRELIAKYPHSLILTPYETFLGNGWYAVDPYRRLPDTLTG